ncbi:protein artemis-like isoform X1 [Diachasmimorpha longicaudata]|uniref:protein artemis-like isoform X1 n=1 Tax=Diachasmimorpha longicaudata TaxID=58733 RepID=UPI0030B918F6
MTIHRLVAALCSWWMFRPIGRVQLNRRTGTWKWSFRPSWQSPTNTQAIFLTSVITAVENRTLTKKPTRLIARTLDNCLFSSGQVEVIDKMSTFRGIIEELPGISMDRFQEENRSCSTVFFLSHFHTDHLEGLNTHFFEQLVSKKQYLYCSPITKTFLRLRYDLIGEQASRIAEITICNPIVVTYRDPSVSNSDVIVTVTAVPAGHCPGSIMLLFEADRNDKKVTVLCTGDFRINREDFSKLKPLHDKVSGKLVPKAFDNIYLDTTFYNKRFSYFPSRQETLDVIVSDVQEWLGKNDKNHVFLEISAYYGSEDLFSKLSAAVKKRIHVNLKVQDSYRYIPELNLYSTENAMETRIHACVGKYQRRYLKSDVPLPCKPEVEAQNILTIVPSAQRWADKDLRKGFIEREARKLYVCYSCHASYNELKEFIDYFKPKKIHPCVVPDIVSKNAWMAEAKKKITNFEREINYTFLRASEGAANSLDWDLMEYKSFKKSERTNGDSSDDDF